MRIDILTLFPEMFEPVLNASIIGRARERGQLEIQVTNIRDFADNKHKQVDDYPFGGGAGMVLAPQPVFDAIEHIKSVRHPWNGKVIYMSPQGRVLSQSIVRELSQEKELIILCGHYEGIDQRILDALVDEEISIGDYILTGGELPAMVLVDSIGRLVPGVLGKEESHQKESFSDGLLEYPQYTRPQNFRGMEVPAVLVSGHHAKIEKWRRQQSLLQTYKKRPELLEKALLDDEDKVFLSSID